MEYPNFATAKMAELVSFYNEHAEEKVKRFANKEDAVTACQVLIAKLEGTALPEAEEELAAVVEEASATSLLGQLTAAGSSEGKKSLSKNEGVWNNVKMLFDQGLTNKETLEKIHELYGNSNTSYACIAWYRNKYKKTSDAVKAQDQAKINQVVEFGEKHGLTEEALLELASMMGVVLPVKEEAQLESEAQAE